MVLTDGIVHFLKIENLKKILPKLSCGFKSSLRTDISAEYNPFRTKT